MAPFKVANVVDNSLQMFQGCAVANRAKLSASIPSRSTVPVRTPAELQSLLDRLEVVSHMDLHTETADLVSTFATY